MAGPSRPSVPGDLDDHIDALYRLPLAEFTAARNALAKTLPSPDAARVKSLAKPSVIAWAVNQVWWNARSVYDAMLTAGRALRAAEIAAIEKPAAGKSKRPSVPEAAAAHRKATTDAVHQAVRLSAAAKLHPQVDALTRMLEAISLAPPEAHPHGRMTESVQPAGFEALFGVQPAGPAATAPSSVKSAPPARGSGAAAKVTKLLVTPRQEAEAERARREAVAAATRTLSTASRKEATARKAADDASRAVADAERMLVRLRNTLAESRAALADAERDRRQAEAALVRVSGPSSAR